MHQLEYIQYQGLNNLKTLFHMFGPQNPQYSILLRSYMTMKISLLYKDRLTRQHLALFSSVLQQIALCLIAIECYQQCIQKSTYNFDWFSEEFMADSELIIRYGIDPIDIPLMLDYLKIFTKLGS